MNTARKYTATLLVRCHGYAIEMTLTGDDLERWLREIETLLARLRSRGAEPDVRGVRNGMDNRA